MSTATLKNGANDLSGKHANPVAETGDSSSPAPSVLKTAPIAPEIQQASGLTKSAGIQNETGLFEREDWTLFRSLNTLPQKAGVPLNSLPRLVCKELADNAFDASGDCQVGMLDGRNGFYVQDGGGGIPGTDAEIARLFSVRRPLTSSKLIRLPTRGALGNGLRVVAGAVLASRGSLTVATRGRVLKLAPRDDGHTDHELIRLDATPGTRIELCLGDPFKVTRHDLNHAETSIGFAGAGGPTYRGKTSPHWYDADGF